MPTRREFLLSAAGATVLLTVGGCAALGGASDNAVEAAGDGLLSAGEGVNNDRSAINIRPANLNNKAA